MKHFFEHMEHFFDIEFSDLMATWEDCMKQWEQKGCDHFEWPPEFMEAMQHGNFEQMMDMMKARFTQSDTPRYV